MNRLTRILLGSAVILLSLTACSVLVDGAFSQDLTQVQGVADLSRVIPGAQASSFNLSILRAGTNEFVLLYSSAPFDSTQNHLVVLSPDLKVLNTFTGDALSALSPAGVLFSGNSAVTHLVDGHLIIGNVETVPAAGGGLTLLDKVNASLYGSTIVGPSSASFTWTGFGVDSTNNLNWTEYASDWSASSSRSQPVGRPVQLIGVFSDPENALHNVAFLVFGDSSSDTQYFMQVPKDPDIVNGLPRLPLFNNAAYPVFTKSGLGHGQIFLTVDSIVGYEDSSQSWVRFAPSSPDSVTRLSTAGRKQGLQTAFSFSGGYYCTWDPSALTLVKSGDWW